MDRLLAMRWICGVGLCLLLTGCGLIGSASNSSAAVLELIMAPFKSASESLGSGHAGMEDYRRDVRAFAVTFLDTGGTEADFLRGVTFIAETHGVVHWEAEPDTLIALGEGMRESGIDEAELRGRLDATDPEVAKLILVAYESPES